MFRKHELGNRYLPNLWRRHPSENVPLDWPPGIAVLRWCRQYYERYSKAIFTDIQNRFITALKDNEFDEDEAEYISNLLSSLSGNFERRSSQFNTEYHIEAAEKFCRSKHLEQVSQSIQSYLTQGRIEDAEACVKGFAPLIPAELLEWQVFYVELMRQLGIEPEHYEPLLDSQHKWDSKIESLVKTLSNVHASLRRKEFALQNLDSLLEHDGFDQSAYSQKRHGFLLEIKALDQKLKDTQKDLDELRQRKSEEAEFTKIVSRADPFKTLTYRIINLPFADKYRLLRGVLDGPIVVGLSTSNPHVGRNPEDEMMKILEGIETTIRHNHSLLLELLPE